MKIDKLIVTRRPVLRRKYGPRIRAVDAALQRLVAADARRGMVSRVVNLDALEPRLAKAGDGTTALARLTKQAIDRAWRKHAPDYLMILGGPDVVVLQDLANPMNVDADPENDDEDAVVPSDLPYACEGPWSADVADCLGPTRVVGRLPDLPGAAEPSYLVRLLRQAAAAQSRSREEYAAYFGLSAQVWQKSTAESLMKLFNDNAKMRVSPPGGPAWGASTLAPRMHFINCHGGSHSPRFLGEEVVDENSHYQTAHHSPRIAGRIQPGAVVAAECCYGAQVYDPRLGSPARDAGTLGLCTAYLAEGAYGFFGSTTIAYGPSEGNGQADWICQYFMRAVLDGASLGRAALEARQQFAAQLSHLDPSDLKTLAQFQLLGDPAIHPIESAPRALTRSRPYRMVFRGRGASVGSRSFRRERARRVGLHLAASLGSARPLPRATVPPAVRRVLFEIAADSGINPVAPIRTYRIVNASGRRASPVERRIHMLAGSKRDAPAPRVVAIFATTENGQIVHLRRVHGR